MTLMQRILEAFKLKNEPTDFFLDQHPANNATFKYTEPINMDEICEALQKTQELSEIVNTTTDEKTFFCSLTELKHILQDLIKYEDLCDFAILPSEHLKNIEDAEPMAIESFYKRTYEEAQKEAVMQVPISEKETSLSDGVPTLSSETQVINQLEPEGDNIQEGKDSSQTSEEPSLLSSYADETQDFEETPTPSYCNYDTQEETTDFPYRSSKMIIKGLHLYFIDVAREIIEAHAINTIPLLREYHISEDELKQIIVQMQEANILDSDNNVLLNAEEFEKFIDIYEPSIFECSHCVFDKETFMHLGETVFENGVESTYNYLSSDEVVDYLNIMELLNVLLYNNDTNNYDILISKEDFYKLCDMIPASLSNSNYKGTKSDYDNVNYDNMSGIEFEQYCAYILSQNGFSGIKLTPPSGDHGIDLLAEKEDITYAIQCKCYSENIGNSAIQQAHTGKSLYHKDIAVVMTNRYFTSQAIEESKSLGVKLWDRNVLNEMIKKCCTGATATPLE